MVSRSAATRMAWVGLNKPVYTCLRTSIAMCASKQDGGSNVIDKPGSLSGLDPKKAPSKRLPPNYRVLLHNDNVNRREYVVKALLKVVDGMTVDIAVNIMQEAHASGVALVLVCSQEEAEKYVTGLRRNGLTSTLEPSGGKNGGNSDN